MFKRIVLFLTVNFLIVMTISVLLKVFHVKPYLTAHGLDLYSLLIFCLIWGMGGALVSLLISRKAAKWLFSIDIIDPRHLSNPRAVKLYDTVVTLSQKFGLPEIPQVGIFRSQEANAFATGPTKRLALVAVSTGLLENLSDNELEAVLGHEIAHIANGDMVTMTLLQGVINAFVMFLARILAFALSGGGSRDRNSKNHSPMQFFLLTIMFEFVFMLLGSMVIAAFSRYREYRADRGSAKALGAAPMISALTKLQEIQNIVRVPADRRMRNLDAMMIAKPRSSRHHWISLFATHPPLEKRIAALQKMKAESPHEVRI